MGTNLDVDAKLKRSELTVYEWFFIPRHTNLEMGNPTLLHELEVLLWIWLSNQRPRAEKLKISVYFLPSSYSSVLPPIVERARGIPTRYSSDPSA